VALLNQRRFESHPLAALVRESAGPAPVHLGRLGDVVAARRPADFASRLLGELPKGPGLVCIEGEILRHRSIRDPLVAAIRRRGLRPWHVAPERTNAAGALVDRAVSALRVAAVRAILAVMRWRPRPPFR
jgi:hypothetical protein